MVFDDSFRITVDIADKGLSTISRTSDVKRLPPQRQSQVSNHILPERQDILSIPVLILDVVHHLLDHEYTQSAQCPVL